MLAYKGNSILLEPEEHDVKKDEIQNNLSESVEATSRNIERSLRYNQHGVKVLCLSLSKSIETFIEETPRPNDPSKLDFHEKYLSILETILIHLDGIESAVDNTEKAISKPDIDAAKESVYNLRDSIKKWWSENESETINYGANISILGMGAALLIFCGVPAPMATGISVALGNSKKALAYLSSKKTE